MSSGPSDRQALSGRVARSTQSCVRVGPPPELAGSRGCIQPAGPLLPTSRRQHAFRGAPSCCGNSQLSRKGVVARGLTSELPVPAPRATARGSTCLSNVASSTLALSPPWVEDGPLRPRRRVRVWLTGTDRPAWFPCSFAIVIWGILTQKKPFAGEWARPGGGAPPSVPVSGGRGVHGARVRPRCREGGSGGARACPGGDPATPRPTASLGAYLPAERPAGGFPAGSSRCQPAPCACNAHSVRFIFLPV